METTRSEERLEKAQEKFAEQLRGTSQAAEGLFEAANEEFAEQGQELKAALAAAGDLAKVTAQAVQEQVVVGAKATDEAIRKYPYRSIGVALGVGLLIGYLIKRK